MTRYLSWLAAPMVALSAIGPAHAELIVGLTNSNLLVSFDSATPGTVATIGTITGVAATDTLVGIDRRPQALAPGIPGPNNGRIYALGVHIQSGTGRIYTIDETTAQATLVSTLAADPADTTTPFPFISVSASPNWGIDFNPVVDRLRAVSDLNQNLRINVDNGLVQLDVPLAYQSGDPNFNQDPTDVAVAYANNVGGAVATILRGVDVGRSPDLLLVHSNPNGGTLQSVSPNPLPFNSAPGLTGFDISGLGGTLYFSATPAGSSDGSLFYAGGPSSVSLIGEVGNDFQLVDIAAPVGLIAAVAMPEPGSLALLGFGGLALLALRRRRGAV